MEGERNPWVSFAVFPADAMRTKAIGSTPSLAALSQGFGAIHHGRNLGARGSVPESLGATHSSRVCENDPVQPIVGVGVALRVASAACNPSFDFRAYVLETGS